MHLAKHSISGLEFAIKTIDKKKVRPVLFPAALALPRVLLTCQAGTAGARMVEFEIAILKRVAHEYIISLKEIFESSKVCRTCARA